ncbi:MAG TPA: family 16 glycoside hydrolase [Terracidiphilus sp.]
MKINDWNQHEIIARGGMMMHIVNGHLMAELIDHDPNSSNNRAGKIGIELEGTPAKVSVRDIWIRELP